MIADVACSHSETDRAERQAEAEDRWNNCSSDGAGQQLERLDDFILDHLGQRAQPRDHLLVDELQHRPIDGQHTVLEERDENLPALDRPSGR
jgi:hypothetical protein